MRYSKTVTGKTLPEQTKTIVCLTCSQPAVVRYVTNYPRRCDECRADKERQIEQARRTRAVRDGKRPALVRYAGWDPTEH